MTRTADRWITPCDRHQISNETLHVFRNLGESLADGGVDFELYTNPSGRTAFVKIVFSIYGNRIGEFSVGTVDRILYNARMQRLAGCVAEMRDRGANAYDTVRAILSLDDEVPVLDVNALGL